MANLEKLAANYRSEGYFKWINTIRMKRLFYLHTLMMTLDVENYKKTIAGIALSINRSFDSSLSSRHLTRMTRMIRI